MLRIVSNTYFWLLGLLLLALIPPMLIEPLGGDQGIFAYVGQTILDGGAPYKDAWDIKGPLVYLIYAFGQWLTPGKILGVLFVDMLLLGAAFWSLFWLAGHFRRQLDLFCLAGIFLISCGPLNLHQSGQPDTWAGYLTFVLAVLLYMPPTPRTAILSGILLGFLTLLKPHFILLGALSGCLLIADRYWKLLLLHMFAGFVILAAAAFYIQTSGAGYSFTELILFYLHAHGKADVHRLLKYFSAPIFNLYLMLIAISLTGCWLIYKTLDRRMGIILGSLLTIHVIIVGLQQTLLTYQFVPVLFMFSIPMAWLFLLVLPVSDNESVQKNILGTGCALIVPAMLMTVYYGPTPSIWKSCVGNVHSTACLSNYAYQGFSSVDRLRVATWLKQNLSRNSRIYIFGFDTALYLESGFPPISRFIYNYPLVTQEPSFRTYYRNGLMAQLQTDPPAAILVLRKDATPVTDPEPGATSVRLWRSSEQMLWTFPELKALIANHYRLAHRDEYALIYTPSGG